MNNCHILYINGHVFCITHTWAKAENIARMLGGLESLDWKIESAYIPHLAVF